MKGRRRITALTNVNVQQWSPIACVTKVLFADHLSGRESQTQLILSSNPRDAPLVIVLRKKGTTNLGAFWLWPVPAIATKSPSYRFAVLTRAPPVLPEQISSAQSESVLTALIEQMGTWNRTLWRKCWTDICCFRTFVEHHWTILVQ